VFFYNALRGKGSGYLEGGTNPGSRTALAGADSMSGESYASLRGKTWDRGRGEPFKRE